MAISRKGMRRIVVDDAVHYWTSTGTDAGIDVVVSTDDAFVPGQRGQLLTFAIDYDTIMAPHEHGWSGSVQRAVTPALVRRAIELARQRQPPFTGRAGQPDLRLTRQETRDAVGETPQARIERVLGAASAALDAANLESAIGVFGVIGQTLAAHSELGHPAVLDAWFAGAAATLRAQPALIQRYADAILATLAKDWPAWQQQWPRCCERRSALETFLSCARHAGLDDLIAAVDTGPLDARMNEHRRERRRLRHGR